MKLKAGDKIKVHGDPKLAKMTPGVYWIDFVTHVTGVPCYGLRKYRARKIHVQHWAKCVDHLLGDQIKRVP